MQASYKKHTLQFKFKAGTSRGVLTQKDSWFIFLSEPSGKKTGIGECSPLPGLSPDDTPEFEDFLQNICADISSRKISPVVLSKDPSLNNYPSIRFALETAMLDLGMGGRRVLFDTFFSRGLGGIPVNGLVWMGDPDLMEHQIEDKLSRGFTCIKIKIGAIDFDQECALLEKLRKKVKADRLELRVDANGAFSVSEAMGKLKALSRFEVHSIEQPIAEGQHEAMMDLCRHSPVPVALDEELIGKYFCQDKKKLLEMIRPAYIVLKPTLLGGFAACLEWIRVAEECGCGWWTTSALESNIGLNAIAQFTSSLPAGRGFCQGLGTGQLYHNNIKSPLVINSGSLRYNPEENWDLSFLKNS